MAVVAHPQVLGKLGVGVGELVHWVEAHRLRRRWCGHSGTRVLEQLSAAPSAARLPCGIEAAPYALGCRPIQRRVCNLHHSNAARRVQGPELA